jgi:hypothetical protein
MKPWADEIRRHIDVWANQLGILNWWPRYVYHVPDANWGIVTLHLDDALAFTGLVTFEEIPF